MTSHASQRQRLRDTEKERHTDVHQGGPAKRRGRVGREGLEGEMRG